MSRALVLGLGRFGGGIAACRFLHRRGYGLRVADRSPEAGLASSRKALADLPGIEWCLGREDPRLLEGIDLMVVNPAVRPDHPLLRLADRRGIPCTQEVELFLQHYPGRVVLVTGTNGKSTTATLLHRALCRSGLPALLGGNIGNSLLEDEKAWQPDQIAVLEVSSFQLERLDPGRFPVAGAVLTRVGRDHLDRHGTLAAYRAAKARAAAAARDFFVWLDEDPVASAFATPARRRLACGAADPPPGAVGLAGSWLVGSRSRGGARGPRRLLHARALRLLGDFHLDNAMLAAAAAMACGAEAHPAALGIALCRPLPFRLQLLAMLGGVRIYDNAVSTELESTRSALASLGGPVHWVGGGKSKEDNLDRVAAALAPALTSAHLFGAVAQELGQRLSRRLPATVHETLQQALNAALDAAAPGDAVLFSPGFASFDQFPNFRARALEFHRWVAETSAGVAATPHRRPAEIPALSESAGRATLAEAQCSTAPRARRRSPRS